MPRAVTRIRGQIGGGRSERPSVPLRGALRFRANGDGEARRPGGPAARRPWRPRGSAARPRWPAEGTRAGPPLGRGMGGTRRPYRPLTTLVSTLELPVVRRAAPPARITRCGPVRLAVPGRTLLLVAGMPGAGKSTLLARLPRSPGVVVLDSDDHRRALADRLANVPYDRYRPLVHLRHRLDVVRRAASSTPTVVVHLPATDAVTRRRSPCSPRSPAGRRTCSGCMSSPPTPGRVSGTGAGSCRRRRSPGTRSAPQRPRPASWGRRRSPDGRA